MMKLVPCLSMLCDRIFLLNKAGPYTGTGKSVVL
jgi:hypothetical protein